jgi:Coenzyme PQQ synthesis protein D (PqqD)
VLKLSEHVRSNHNRDGAVILDIRQGQMFRLNLVGSRMLEFLKKGYSETQIVDEVCRAFGVDRETVETDVREFLVHLEKHHLLEQKQPEKQPAL